MSEILSGARYTFGGLLVLTAWSFCAVKVYEARVDAHVDAMVTAQADADRALMEFGPAADGSEDQRYDAVVRGFE
jgi:hypothetical protein